MQKASIHLVSKSKLWTAVDKISESIFLHNIAINQRIMLQQKWQHFIRSKNVQKSISSTIAPHNSKAIWLVHM